MKLFTSYVFPIVILFCFYSPSLASEVVYVSESDSEIIFPIPDGWCNITNEPSGIIAKQVLEQTSQNNPAFPTVKIIIAKCEPSAAGTIYPWAWIGLKKQVFTSQNSYNKMFAKLLNNEVYSESLIKSIENSRSDAFENVLGLESSSEANQGDIIWADDDSLVLRTQIKTRINGKIIKELSLTSTTIINDLSVLTYVYQLEGYDPSLKSLLAMLINNSVKIKSLN
jgi:hypothetical protein